MPKNAPKTAAKKHKPDPPAPPAPRRTLEELRKAGADLDTITSIVCSNLDLPVGQIIAKVREKTGEDLNREQPYEILRREAREGRLRYVAPLDSALCHKLLEGTAWLRKARVVRSSSQADIARHAALLLLEFAENWDKPDLHIGIAGGDLMALTVEQWAEFLKQSAKLRFKNLYVHALLAAAFDPRRSPHGFVRYLLDAPFKTEFIGLPTPPMLTPEGMSALRDAEGSKEVFERAAELDLIVTSAGAHWAKGCSGLHGMYREAPDVVGKLNAAGCIGDVIWQPFGPHGPIALNEGKRAVSLLELSELPSKVAAGKRVLLVLAQCGGKDCLDPKDEILRAVLGWENGITDLVVDARAAARALSR